VQQKVQPTSATQVCTRFFFGEVQPTHGEPHLILSNYSYSTCWKSSEFPYPTHYTTHQTLKHNRHKTNKLTHTLFVLSLDQPKIGNWKFQLEICKTEKIRKNNKITPPSRKNGSQFTPTRPTFSSQQQLNISVWKTLIYFNAMLFFLLIFC